MVSDNVSPRKQVLGHIADIRKHPSATTEKVDVHIQGVVWKHREFKDVIFIDLSDPSGFMQIVCRKSDFSANQWQNIQKLRHGNQVDVEGWTHRTERGYLSVLANKITRRILQVGETYNASLYLPEKGAYSIHRLFMLARVKRVLQDRLRTLNYDEIAIPVMKVEGIEEASFSPQLRLYGIGPPIPIINSPAGLLFRAMLCGIHEVFAFGQIISETLAGLDESSKYEATVLCIRKVYPQTEDMTRLAEDLIRNVFTHQLTKATEAWKDPEQIISDRTPPDFFAVQRPTLIQASFLERLHNDSGVKQTTINSPFMLLWPRHRLLAEGGIEKVDDQVSIGYLTVFLGNIVSVILESANSRPVGNQKIGEPPS